MLDKGMTLESVGRAMGVSTSHVQRMRAAHNRGEVKAKHSSLSSCMKLISTGLPFRRVAWPEEIFYYYDNDEQSKWFIKVNKITGCEIIWYSLDLSLEDLMAKDWVVLTWEAVNDDKRTD
jgi:hypothetical protein